MIKFGTDGWRSLMSDDFTEENIKKVAYAIASYLKESGQTENGIFIGYDTRNNSSTFAKACAKVLLANNIKVYLPKRETATPITAFANKAYNLDGAIMITASHNPAAYNGIKFIPYYAGPATADITKKIEDALMANENKQIEEVELNNSENVFEVDPIDKYIEHLKEVVSENTLKNAGLKIIINPMFGAAYGVFGKVLEAFGVDYIALNDTADPNFSGLTPEPIPKNMASTIEELKSGEYDVALGLDGDADRFGVIDSKGKYIMPNHALALIADYLVSIKGFKGALVRSVATTHFLDRIAEENNLKAIETPVGFKYIGQIMREEPVVLGGEESAGMSILGHIPEKDGILAGLLLAEITAYYKKPLSESLEDLFLKYSRKYLSRRIDLELTQEKKEQLINGLKNNPPTQIIGLNVKQRVEIDGVKFILEEGSWLLARPSGTEPIVRIYVETDQEQKLDKLEQYVNSLT